jgi:colanic acid/amylovoran biosynthesis glycosyltransferase
MLATGMPVVSTRHCDIPSIVSHGETGLLAKEGDADELAGHLIHLADHPENWMRLGAAGRSYVEREHDSRKQAAKLAELYRRL